MSFKAGSGTWEGGWSPPEFKASVDCMRSAESTAIDVIAPTNTVVVPTNDALDSCERAILAHLHVPFRQSMIPIQMPDGAVYHINTLETMVPNANATAPLVR